MGKRLLFIFLLLGVMFLGFLGFRQGFSNWIPFINKKLVANVTRQDLGNVVKVVISLENGKKIVLLSRDGYEVKVVDAESFAKLLHEIGYWEIDFPIKENTETMKASQLLIVFSMVKSGVPEMSLGFDPYTKGYVISVEKSQDEFSLKEMNEFFHNHLANVLQKYVIFGRKYPEKYRVKIPKMLELVLRSDYKESTGTGNEEL